jgi:hypothetical protein
MSMDELLKLVRAESGLFVRYSEGIEADQDGGSMDTESGLELPGLSVNPLLPEAWWTRPLEDWLARQLCQYKHLKEKNPERFAWVVRGRCVAHGPDCEPLLVDVEQVARLDDTLLAEAEHVYEERFDAETGPQR